MQSCKSLNEHKKSCWQLISAIYDSLCHHLRLRFSKFIICFHAGVDGDNGMNRPHPLIPDMYIYVGVYMQIVLNETKKIDFCNISTPFKSKISFSRLKYVRGWNFHCFLFNVNHIKKCARSPNYNDIVRGRGRI